MQNVRKSWSHITTKKEVFTRDIILTDVGKSYNLNKALMYEYNIDYIGTQILLFCHLDLPLAYIPPATMYIPASEMGFHDDGIVFNFQYKERYLYCNLTKHKKCVFPNIHTGKEMDLYLSCLKIYA